MIEQLYLLRHGIALPRGTPGILDDERPLTSKGERRMREIGEALERLDLKIDRVVTSPLPRARRTAEIVAEALGLYETLEESDTLRAGSDAVTIRRWLARRSEARLMIVGHNPELSDLIGLLVLDEPNASLGDLKKGGVAALVGAGTSVGRYQIEWIATPRLLRKPL